MAYENISRFYSQSPLKSNIILDINVKTFGTWLSINKIANAFLPRSIYTLITAFLWFFPPSDWWNRKISSKME